MKCERLCRDVTVFFERFRAYHRKNITWGSLHIVLDDLNLEDHSVEFCLSYAKENGDREGAELAEILRKLSRTQRRRIAREARVEGVELAEILRKLSMPWKRERRPLS